MEKCRAKVYSQLLQWLSLLMLLALLPSCTEEFDLKTESSEQRLVVQGWITNKPGPYLVRLTMSSNKLSQQEVNGGYFFYNTSMVPVKDALIIISDNAGTVDTLKQRLPRNAFDKEFTINEGFYETGKLQGKIGRTYFLTVKVHGKEYSASCYMPPVTSIDSISYIAKKDPFKNDGTSYHVPTITFQEPQNTRDYYLFSLAGEDEWVPFYFGGSNRHWNVSILSDELLPPYVRNYSIDDGVSPSGMDFYNGYYSGDEVSVNMYSLTKEAFEYFKALISQFSNDGGAYQPAPASPPTNISSGALGFFGASAVSSKMGVVK